MAAVTHVAIIGGGPGGYEAALVAAQLGADVTVVDSDGIGGSAVLTDCVPSKTLIATAEVMTGFEVAPELGITLGRGRRRRTPPSTSAQVNQRVLDLAQAQSDRHREAADPRRRPRASAAPAGSTARSGSWPPGRTAPRRRSRRTPSWSRPAPRRARCRPPQPDGERILTWEQVYDLDERPEHLVVVGSGVTGAEFAGAYNALGIEVTLVSSRDRVLPGEDADAAEVLEQVFKRRGMTVLGKSRMAGGRPATATA